MVYEGRSAEELEALYSLSPLIPDFPRIVEGWGTRSTAVAAELPHLADLAYGPGSHEDMTIFPAGGSGAPGGSPLLMFVHGGYWQETYKESWLYLAPAFVRLGIAYAAVNYELAPHVTVDRIVDQVREAVLWVHARAAGLGIDPSRVFVAGHSAGGHLVAMLLLTDWAEYTSGAVSAPLQGGCAISGLFDLEPIRFTSVNDALGLDHAAALRNSPLQVLRARVPPAGGMESPRVAPDAPAAPHEPTAPPPLICAVGGGETAEYLRQQQVFVHEWRARDLEAQVVEMPGRHHFSVVDELGREGSPLHAAVVRMIQERSTQGR